MRSNCAFEHGRANKQYALGKCPLRRAAQVRGSRIEVLALWHTSRGIGPFL